MAKAEAVKFDHGWELHLDVEAATQVRSLSRAVAQGADYLATVHGGEPEDYQVKVTLENCDEFAPVLELQNRLAERARQVQEAAEERRTYVQHLTEHELSVRDLAALLEVSPGRISQMKADWPEKVDA